MIQSWDSERALQLLDFSMLVKAHYGHGAKRIDR